MLHLQFAPSADLLVPLLLEKLRPVWKDPFQPPTVIVPSPAVGKWLKLRLADHTPGPAAPTRGLGCIANLEMLTLERFLWKVLRPADDMRRLDMAVLQQVIYALLTESLLKDSAYVSVRKYLKKPDGTIDPVKRAQLSSKIARQFQEYEFNRPSVWDEEHHRWKPDFEGHKEGGIDAEWLNDNTYCGSDTENELWQKDLYCKAHKCLNKTGGPDSVKYVSLPHLYRQRRESGLENKARWTVPPDRIFLYGVSKVSHFHRNTLVEISQMPDVDMHVFLTNPCAEFWEDVDTSRHPQYRRKWEYNSPREKIGIPSRNPDDYIKSELEEFAHLPDDPALLELWGRAGKENIYLWCPQAEWNFEYFCPEWVLQGKPPETLLKTLQMALLRRESDRTKPADSGVWKDDGSLQVLACPDPTREVEELREQILDLIAEDSKKLPLRLNDIAVYLPDPGAYVTQIHRVFGAFRQDDPGYIPYSILGAPGSDSLFAQGMHTLLEVIDGSFDRAHFFALLRNPIVQSTRKISPDDVTVWESWAEELGIFRGFNKEHRAQMGNKGQTVTDIHTFELGIARLMLGNLAAGPTALKYQLLNDDGNKAFPSIPPFRDFDTSDTDSAEQFCGLAEDLYKNVMVLKDLEEQRSSPVDKNAAVQMPLCDAVDAMTDLVWGWFGTIPDDTTGKMAAEERVQRDFLDALPIIKLQQDLVNRDCCAGAKEFLPLVKECLPEELPAGSKAWTGGITFAPLRPAMIVPHRVIFVLGLGATAFPGTNENPTWDLLSRKRIVGDSDRVRDNRFAFLELLHAAQEKLILSFRADNMQKEEELQPSSVILELESYLKGKGLSITDEDTKEERCTVRREIPWIVHESLDEIIKGGRKQGSWDEAEIGLAGLENGQKTKYRYGAGHKKQNSAMQCPLRTDIYRLRKFFANPLEYHLSKTLGIELDEQPATMGATDEPLHSGNLEWSVLQKTIWTELLDRVFLEIKNAKVPDAETLRDEAGKIARKVHDDYCIQGGSPEAQFCTMERQNLITWAQDCVPITLNLVNDFGDHQLLQNADLSLKRPGVPGELEVGMGNGMVCSVECRHGLVLVPRGSAGAIGIISIKKEGEAKENPDLWLTGVIQWLAEQKFPQSERYAVRLVQLNRGDGKKNKAGSGFADMKKLCEIGHDIKDWFGGLIRTMLIERSCDHLPFAVVQELCEMGDDNKLDLKKLTKDNIEELLSKEFSPYRCYLEAFNLVEAKIPDLNDEELQKLARARFAPMLEGWVHE